jgi:hypothetical protein
MECDTGSEIRLHPRLAPFGAMVVEANQGLTAALNDEEIG